MNQKDKSHFKKSIENSSINNNNRTNSQQREKIKLHIMEKFSVSSKEAEILLSHIENNSVKNVNSQNDKFSTISSNVQSNDDLKINNGEYAHNDVIHQYNNINPEKIENKNINEKNNSASQGNYDLKKDSNHSKQQFHDDNQQKLNSKTEKKSVDSILTDIVSNYNQQISVKVEHVDLTFEVQNEKVDTLKESFIRKFNSNGPKKFKIPALRDITFEIYKGEKVGIIGYNGAGKSTLLNVITGIYPPDKGDVTTFGKISPLLSLGAGFDYNYTGRQNIFLNAAILGYDKQFLEAKLDDIIEFSELGEFIDIPIKNYSSGMLAKLGFSIATAVNPDILIIDEILGVGDVNFAKKSADKIQSLMDGGTTVILVSHSIPQIRSLCDKAIWIDQGMVREIGEVNAVCDDYLKDSEKASNKQLANIQLR